jgi:hypothetical protein
MSNSHKKTPKGPIAVSTSNKKYKKIENQKKRIKETVALKKFDPDDETKDIEVILPHEKEFGDEWASPRDGKTLYYTEADIRKIINSTIQIELNNANGREHYAYCLYNTFYSKYLLEDLYKYTDVNTIDELLKVPITKINEFIKIKAREELRK